MTQEINYLHLLAGLVRCQPCGTEMTATHNPDNRYVCPTLIESGADDCTTPPIDAEYLDRLVVTRMVENMFTGKNLQTVVKMAQEQSDEIALQDRVELERINSCLAGQDRSRRELMAAVETERATFAKVAGRVQELNDAKTRLEAQAMEAKKQLDIQEFVSDEACYRPLDAISTSLDPHINLRRHAPPAPGALRQTLFPRTSPELVKPIRR